MHSRLITPGDEFFLAVECKRLMMFFNSARRHTKRVKPSSDANRHLTRDLFDLMRGRTFEKVRKGSEKPMGNWQTAWTPTQNVNDAISTEVPLRNEKFSQGFFEIAGVAWRTTPVFDSYWRFAQATGCEAVGIVPQSFLWRRPERDPV